MSRKHRGLAKKNLDLQMKQERRANIVRSQKNTDYKGKHRQ